MRLLIILSAILAGCEGKPSLYRFDSARQFKCDMDPYMQQCANHAIIRQHLEDEGDTPKKLEHHSATELP